MSASTALQRSAVDEQLPMQWRGSDDGVTWTPWTLLTHIHALLPWYMFYQGRILIDGEWHASPIETDQVP